MIIFLKNNDKFEIEANSSAYDLACKLGISKNAVVAKINDRLVDLSTVLQENDTVRLITYKDQEGIEVIRHSSAHILAKAILDIDPTAKLAIGPAIENGFYYDILSEKVFSAEDLPIIEEKMRTIIKQDLKFEKSTLTKGEAIEYFRSRNQKYKIELAESISDETVGIYTIDDLSDLCRGPHVPSTKYVPLDAFRLTSVAGAYWRGNSKNDMLQRIYGAVFSTKKETDGYFKMLEEAKARDHRKLGTELELFHLDDVAPGNVFWLKNGCIVFNLLKEYITKVIKKHKYFLVQTPQLMNRSLWETSGHWEKFKENMFIVDDEDTTMAIKPMNCPGHIICYKTGAVKSYRDLPIRMAEFGLCHRNESSGSMHGLMRLRAFMQDDGHIFCSAEQIVSETIDVCSMIKEIYATFGFTEIAVKFSDRPEKRVGSDEVWDIAEKSLQEAAEAAGLTYTVNKGEGAFYGPKLEFVLKDCLGRDWQCGTLQVDFNLPERFGITYTDSDGNRKIPVMLHRALVGSLERFMGILVEHYAGKFPFWLATVQVAITSVTDEAINYAKEILRVLEASGIRAILDIENEKITYKIRRHSVSKIPAIMIVGKKEMADKTVGIRLLGTNDTKLVDFVSIVSIVKELMDAQQPKS
ncbi:MAG: threonine--tRNA ligase [Holosporales bacterium]|jgi:threonyl-tRNA synthetase|nr:threonine--tRNA ligase [Holosporales bacterium]